MKLKIAIMNGDDIGIEIVPMAKLVLTEALKTLGYDIELIDLPIGELAHSKYGDTFPELGIIIIPEMTRRGKCPLLEKNLNYMLR